MKNFLPRTLMLIFVLIFALYKIFQDPNWLDEDVQIWELYALGLSLFLVFMLTPIILIFWKYSQNAKYLITPIASQKDLQNILNKEMYQIRSITVGNPMHLYIPNYLPADQINFNSIKNLQDILVVFMMKFFPELLHQSTKDDSLAVVVYKKDNTKKIYLFNNSDDDTSSQYLLGLTKQGITVEYQRVTPSINLMFFGVLGLLGCVLFITLIYFILY